MICVVQTRRDALAAVFGAVLIPSFSGKASAEEEYIAEPTAVRSELDVFPCRYTS
jgi:hypothetical protein